MSNLQILIVEDEPRWTDLITEKLASLSPQTSVAQTHESALSFVQQARFDLIILDLALPGTNSFSSDIARGFQLLKELRSGFLNNTAAILIVSGQIKSDQVSEAMQQYKVHHFFDKLEFDDRLFLRKANDALLLARIKRAQRKHNQGCRLRIVFDQHNILGSELNGPKQRPFYVAKSPLNLSVADFVRRANNMNLLVNEGPSAWRPEARALGAELYQILMRDRSIVEGLAATPNPADLWLQFSGPPEGLGVPFELLHDGDDYLAFKHIITREVEPFRESLKRVSFHSFIRSFLGGQVPLRILIVAVDDDSPAYTIAEEAKLLERVLRKELERLGIRPQIQLLSGENSTRTHVSEALRHGGYHIFHYSGHGYHQPERPEVSGIRTAGRGPGTEFLTAADLISLCRGTELRLAYLSCCLGACSSPQIKHGDFFGLFDALARADVPMVLGYRWEVGDPSAMSLAEAFYESLWRTLSPGEALFEARNEISQTAERRDNETWASPVLVMQTT